MGLSYEKIGKELGISRQRVHQILTGYKSPATLYFGSGREFTRGQVRHRDNYICQDCKKRWKYGERKFDVHHLNGLCGKMSRGYDHIKNISELVTLCHKCHFNRPEHKSKKPKLKDFVI